MIARRGAPHRPSLLRSGRVRRDPPRIARSRLAGVVGCAL